MKIEVALLGNPNSGKTTLFNELTGDSKTVGNWTGVTVTLEIGHFHFDNNYIDIIDLPGIYSLFTHSPEQITACEYLLNYHPDVIINVVDSTNLERNLYLTTQLIDTGVPVVVALNMGDELSHQGLILDATYLSKELGVPCVRISATQRTGIKRLMEKVVDVCANPTLVDNTRIASRFSPDLNKHIDETAASLDASLIPKHINPRWLALQKLMEHWPQNKDTDVGGKGDRWEMLIGRERYMIIADIIAHTLKKSPYVNRHSFSRKLDSVLCNKFLALPVFAIIMLAIFYLAFGPVGGFLCDLLKMFLSGWLPRTVDSLLLSAGAVSGLRSLIVEGVIGGVGGVLIFIPQLAILFFCLSILEYSGYMSRAAFMTDRLLSGFGLTGMSFIPMILGFGCSVPAIMSCHVLENRRERLLTMAIVPFMSCGAKMPVYALFVAVFFAANQGLIILGLYALGILVGLITAVLLKPMIMKKERPLFLMEMPPYRKPVWHCVFRTVWSRLWDFISRAGSIILIASVIIWLFSNFNWHLYMVDESNSMLQALGVFLKPIFEPLGFGHWQLIVALLTGFMAKEAVVSTLSVLYGAELLAGSLTAIISPAAALAYLVFILLYTPCIATIAAIRRESRSLKFSFGVIIYQLAVAWGVSFVVYNVVSLFI